MTKNQTPNFSHPFASVLFISHALHPVPHSYPIMPISVSYPSSCHQPSISHGVSHPHPKVPGKPKSTHSLLPRVLAKLPPPLTIPKHHNANRRQRHAHRSKHHEPPSIPKPIDQRSRSQRQEGAHKTPTHNDTRHGTSAEQPKGINDVRHQRNKGQHGVGANHGACQQQEG